MKTLLTLLTYIFILSPNVILGSEILNDYLAVKKIEVMQSGALP
jgi:hypothetical protein